MKKIIVFFIFIFFSTSAFSKEETFQGILQAYWLPVWIGKVNNPQVEYRFFHLEDKEHKSKMIY